MQNIPRGAFCNTFDQILLTFIKLPLVIKTLFLSIVVAVYTGFTVTVKNGIFYYLRWDN